MTSTAHEPTFSRRAVAAMVGVCAVSVLVGVSLALFGGPPDRGPSHGPDSTSASAVGHAAFRELLSALDIPVLVSRSPASRQAARNGLLIVAEPADTTGLRSRISGAAAVLVVLPKRSSHAHAVRADWVGRAPPLPVDAAETILQALAPAGAVARVPHGGTRWAGGPVAPQVRSAQLIRVPNTVPEVAAAQGSLVAAMELPWAPNTRCWVLSDPDVIATHGLATGDNAVLAVWLVTQLRGDGPVVFDETVHGFLVTPSLWRELATFPLSLVFMQGLLGLAALAWLALVRFGTPRPVPAPFAAGKRFLITHTAALQLAGGHSGYVLVRYWRAAMRHVAERLHLPAGLAPPELRQRLNRIATARGVDADLDRFDADASDAASPRARHQARVDRIVKTAARIHRWQEAMLRGT